MGGLYLCGALRPTIYAAPPYSADAFISEAVSLSRQCEMQALQSQRQSGLAYPIGS